MLLPAVSGCAWWPYEVRTTETGMPQYERIRIGYTLHNVETVLTTGVVRSDDEDRQRAEGDFAAAHLQIDYPPPGGNANDHAQVKLKLFRTPVVARVEPTAERGIGRLVDGLFTGKRDERLNVVPASSARPPDGSPFTPFEVRTLEVPRQELDLLLIDLANSGFFDRQQRPDGNVRLDVQIDRGRTVKRWTSQPRLNDFVTRIYRKGHPQ